METVSAGEIIRMAEIPANVGESMTARMGVACPKCHASAGAKCRAAGGKAMDVRVHPERMAKARIAWGALGNETVMGFVLAGRANGDAVRVFARPETVDVGSGVAGVMFARADDHEMGLTAVLLWMGGSRYLVMQVKSEDIKVRRN
jgi:hypothetical protein